MSALAYFLIFAALTVLAIWSPGKRGINGILLILVWAILVAPSWRVVGIDRDVYLEAFANEDSRIEWSYRFISQCVEAIGLDERCVFLLYAMVSVAVVLLAIYLYNRRIWWCVLVYVAHFYVLHAMIQIRCSCAVAFFLLSLVCMVRATKVAAAVWRGLWLNMLAVFWHGSGIIGFIAVVLRHKKFTVAFYVVCVVVSIVMCIFDVSVCTFGHHVGLGVVQNALAKYTEAMARGQQLEYNPLGLYKVFQLFVLIFMFLVHLRVKRYLGSYVILKIWIIGFCIGLVMNDFPAIASRLSEYLSATEIILMPVFAFTVMKRWGLLVLLPYAGVTVFCTVIRAQLLGS